MPLKVSGAVLYFLSVVWHGVEGTREKAPWPPSRGVQESVGGPEEHGPDGGGMDWINAMLAL